MANFTAKISATKRIKRNYGKIFERKNYREIMGKLYLNKKLNKTKFLANFPHI
jgi:hypothetical protein